MPRSRPGQPLVPWSRRGDLFVSLLASILPVVSEKDGPFVLWLCEEVISSQDCTCLLLLGPGTSITAGGQQPRDGQNVLWVDLPTQGGSTVLRLCENLSVCFSCKVVQLFDSVCKYHVLLWCMLCSAFCFSVNACLGGEERI